MAVSIFKRPLNKEVEQIKNDIGIVENGTTATHNISSGQYVIWKGNLCTASSAISSGDTLSSSNLTEVSNGGLNALNGKLTADRTTLEAGASGVTTDGSVIHDKASNTVRIFGYARSSADIGTSTNLGTIPSGYRPANNYGGVAVIAFASGDVGIYGCILHSDGTITQALTANARSVAFFGEYPL